MAKRTQKSKKMRKTIRELNQKIEALTKELAKK
jgi:hypothetical protein